MILNGNDESPYDKEKYYQRAYKAYEYMYENIYAYGITDIDNISIYWNYYILTDSGYFQEEQFGVNIDMKTKYSYDEFADYLDENGNASEYTPEIE